MYLDLGTAKAACGYRNDILSPSHPDASLYYPTAVSTCCSRPTISYRYWDTSLIPDAGNGARSVLARRRRSSRSRIL